jgi:hypothetical protein
MGGGKDLLYQWLYLVFHGRITAEFVCFPTGERAVGGDLNVSAGPL